MTETPTLFGSRYSGYSGTPGVAVSLYYSPSRVLDSLLKTSDASLGALDGGFFGYSGLPSNICSPYSQITEYTEHDTDICGVEYSGCSGSSPEYYEPRGILEYLRNPALF